MLKRNNSIEKLAFPYDNFRARQKDLSVAVYKTLQTNKNLFVRAPTGIGKTISVLFPSMKALNKGLISKIFYITAKTVTRKISEDALLYCEKKGLFIKSITLMAREKICFKENTECNPEYCEFASGHFDRVNAALLDVISNETIITADIVKLYAKKYVVCPFEFSFDIADFCDCIIGDYNHAYDPNASLKRFFNFEKKDYIILVDEAHNLPDRAREMFSATLTLNEFKKALKFFKTKDKKVASNIKKIVEFLKNFSESEAKYSLPDELGYLLWDFSRFVDTFLATSNIIDKEIIELYFRVKDFQRVWENFDENYIFFIKKDLKDSSFSLICLNPSYLLQTCHDKVRTSVFFSATLFPEQYFKEILGGHDNDFILKLPSPFDIDNLLLIVESKISVIFKNRRKNLEKLVKTIYSMISCHEGNYIIFFPSYQYLIEAAFVFEENYPSTKLLLQRQDFTDADKVLFLEAFKEDNSETLVAFAVLGGMFSEGTDLYGKKLIGAVVVTTGLPTIEFKRDMMKNYYISKEKDGFKYAYVYPGMNKVIQAVGRVIRSETDKGVVLLIDERFSKDMYLDLFPNEWQNFKISKNNEHMKKLIYNFWNNIKIKDDN